jgi:nucleotide-binding universal stress UspA family protein
MAPSKHDGQTYRGAHARGMIFVNPMPLGSPYFVVHTCPMARILLPTDFSENAHRATVQAVRLLGPDHRYLLFHAYSGPTLANPLLAELVVEAQAATREQLDLAAERFRQDTGLKDLEVRMVAGPTALAVRSMVRKEGADLVVMGHSGAAGAAFLGSNTTDTIRGGDIAVLAVPKTGGEGPVRRILLASDRSGVSAEGMRALATLVKHTGAEVVVVHITSEPEGGTSPEDEAGLAQALPGVKLQFHTRTADDVATGIVDAARAFDADMVAVVHRPRTGFLDRFFAPSVSRKLALESALPLLVLPQDR